MATAPSCEIHRRVFALESRGSDFARSEPQWHALLPESVKFSLGTGIPVRRAVVGGAGQLLAAFVMKFLFEGAFTSV
jgi:hypothetical protein